jgi:hypothetical protein
MFKEVRNISPTRYPAGTAGAGPSEDRSLRKGPHPATQGTMMDAARQNMSVPNPAHTHIMPASGLAASDPWYMIAHAGSAHPAMATLAYTKPPAPNSMPSMTKASMPIGCVATSTGAKTAGNRMAVMRERRCRTLSGILCVDVKM